MKTINSMKDFIKAHPHLINIGLVFFSTIVTIFVLNRFFEFTFIYIYQIITK